eukprot:12598299-Heterocapsa_arctica.AAC.1
MLFESGPGFEASPILYRVLPTLFCFLPYCCIFVVFSVRLVTSQPVPTVPLNIDKVGVPRRIVQKGPANILG